MSHLTIAEKIQSQPDQYNMIIEDCADGQDLPVSSTQNQYGIDYDMRYVFEWVDRPQ